MSLISGTVRGSDLPRETEEKLLHLLFGQSRWNVGLVIEMQPVGREVGVRPQVVYLEDDGAAVFVRSVRYSGQSGDETVVEYGEAAFSVAFLVHDRLLYDDAADSTSCQSAIEVDTVLRDRPVCKIREVHVLRCLDQTVPELDPPDLHRFEQLLEAFRVRHYASLLTFDHIVVVAGSLYLATAMFTTCCRRLLQGGSGR